MAGFRRAPLAFFSRLAVGGTPSIVSLMRNYEVFSCLLFLKNLRKLVKMLKFGLMLTRREQFYECQIRLSFCGCFAAMLVVCRADKLRDIIWTKLAQMERQSETSFS